MTKPKLEDLSDPHFDVFAIERLSTGRCPAPYRRGAIWRLLVWLLNSAQFQTEANNTAAAVSFPMAMLDLDTFAVLGV